MVKLSQETIMFGNNKIIQLFLQCPGVCSSQGPKSLAHMKQGTQ